MTKYVVICSWLPTTVIDCQQDTVSQGKLAQLYLEMNMANSGVSAKSRKNADHQ